MGPKGLGGLQFKKKKGLGGLNFQAIGTYI